MLNRAGCALLLAVAVAVLSVTLGAAEDPSGTWVGTTLVPNEGKDEVTLNIRKAAGGYSGTMSDTLGMVSKEELRDLKYADGTLEFRFSLSDGTQMTMKLKLAGDKLAGEWIHPGGDAGPITFERKKA